MQLSESGSGPEALHLWQPHRWHRCHGASDHKLGSHMQDAQVRVSGTVSPRWMRGTVTRLTLRLTEIFQTLSFTGKCSFHGEAGLTSLCNLITPSALFPPKLQESCRIETLAAVSVSPTAVYKHVSQSSIWIKTPSLENISILNDLKGKKKKHL